MVREKSWKFDFFQAKSGTFTFDQGNLRIQQKVGEFVTVCDYNSELNLLLLKNHSSKIGGEGLSSRVQIPHL